MPFEVGIWHDVTGINFFRNFTETYSEIVESLQNKTLVVTTIMVSVKGESNIIVSDCSHSSLPPTACTKNLLRSWWAMISLKATL